MGWATSFRQVFVLPWQQAWTYFVCSLELRTVLRRFARRGERQLGRVAEEALAVRHGEQVRPELVDLGEEPRARRGREPPPGCGHYFLDVPGKIIPGKSAGDG